MPFTACLRPRLSHKTVHLRLMRLLAFVALAVGCSEPAAPAAFSGAFSLSSVNQALLPSVQGTFTGAPIVLADTLAFPGSISWSGTIEYTRTSMVQFPGRGVKQLRVSDDASVLGDTLEISFHCPPGSTCTTQVDAPRFESLDRDGRIAGGAARRLHIPDRAPFPRWTAPHRNKVMTEPGTHARTLSACSSPRTSCRMSFRGVHT